MYVSRAVESIRADPLEDDVALVLEPADGADPAAIEQAVADAGGEVARRTQFDDVVATVPQRAVDDLCETEGLAAVQTTDAIGINADELEEDLDPEDEPE